LEHLDAVQVSEKTGESGFIKILLVEDVYLHHIKINPIESALERLYSFIIFTGGGGDVTSKFIRINIFNNPLYTLLFPFCRIYK
jgi:hypothetical protein